MKCIRHGQKVERYVVILKELTKNTLFIYFGVAVIFTKTTNVSLATQVNETILTCVSKSMR